MTSTTGLSLPMCRFVVASRTDRGVRVVKPSRGACVRVVMITASFRPLPGMSSTVAERVMSIGLGGAMILALPCVLCFSVP